MLPRHMRGNRPVPGPCRNGPRLCRSGSFSYLPRPGGCCGNHRSLYTVIRATHKYKDSREQFEMRTHKRLIDIINPTQKTVDALMKLDLPSGVNVEIKL